MNTSRLGGYSLLPALVSCQLSIRADLLHHAGKRAAITHSASPASNQGASWVVLQYAHTEWSSACMV